MNLIIFGAGASYGSGEVSPKPPPMGDKLFEVLQRLFPPTWGQITGDLKSEFSSDFEQGMLQLSESNSHALAPLQIDMAKFFFGFSIGNENLYLEIARRISSRDWDGALVTLNYERLLEMAIGKAGMSASIGGAAPNESTVEVCMPHGCCHIFCDGISATGGVSFDARAVRTSGKPIIVGDPQEFARRITGNVFPPAMSYFMPNKETTSCASFIDSQRARYSELVSNAKSISIVGILPRIHDSHIWKPLADSSADITFCAGADDAPKFEEWATNEKSDGVSIALPGYFDAEFESLMSAVEL